MTSWTELEAYVKRVSYKPGWYITISRDYYGDTIQSIFVTVEAELLDADGSGRVSRVRVDEILLEPNYERLRCAICYLIQRLETHEIDEWLKIDGEHVKDPHPRDFGVWSSLVDQVGHSFYSVVRDGEQILRSKRQDVERMCEQARTVSLAGYRVPAVNASILFNEVPEELLARFPDAPFAAYYFDRADGKRQWGLRSIGDFDVSEIAKQYGGGGHKNAAGFAEVIP